MCKLKNEMSWEQLREQYTTPKASLLRAIGEADKIYINGVIANDEDIIEFIRRTEIWENVTSKKISSPKTWIVKLYISTEDNRNEILKEAPPCENKGAIKSDDSLKERIKAIKEADEVDFCGIKLNMIGISSAITTLRKCNNKYDVTLRILPKWVRKGVNSDRYTIVEIKDLKEMEEYSI